MFTAGVHVYVLSDRSTEVPRQHPNPIRSDDESILIQSSYSIISQYPEHQPIPRRHTTTSQKIAPAADDSGCGSADRKCEHRVPGDALATQLVARIAAVHGGSVGMLGHIQAVNSVAGSLGAHGQHRYRLDQRVLALGGLVGWAYHGGGRMYERYVTKDESDISDSD